MLIRSQDGKKLINLKNVQSIEVCGKVICICFTIDNGIQMGKYFTEEKALKVLDMIQNAYISINSDYKCINDDYWQMVRDSSLVFQMPQDSEVDK